MVIEVFHFVPWDAPGRRDARALCGTRVDRYREHANEPNCPECKRLRALDNDVDVEKAFAPSTPRTQVTSTLSNPLEGYREKTPSHAKRRPRSESGKESQVRIIKSVESIPVEHPVFLIFGQPGICKSSLGYSTKDPLLLDFDKGAHRAANRRDSLVIDTWKDVVELMESPDALDPYASLTVDTVGRCLDVITAHIAATDPKKAPGGNLSQQGWGVLKNTFRTWIANLRTKGKDVLLIAHDKEDKDGDTRIVRPDIVGGSYGEVMKVADFVGYLGMNGRDRILDFNPTDRWVGKNPAGWAPFKVPPVGKSQDFLAELFDQGRAALGSISDASAKVAQVVDEWRDRIAEFTTADQCNAAIPEIKKLPVLVAAQVSKSLMDYAKSAGIPFDAAKKQFVAPVAQPAGAVA